MIVAHSMTRDETFRGMTHCDRSAGVTQSIQNTSRETWFGPKMAMLTCFPLRPIVLARRASRSVSKYGSCSLSLSDCDHQIDFYFLHTRSTDADYNLLSSSIQRSAYRDNRAVGQCNAHLRVGVRFILHHDSFNKGDVKWN